MPELKSLTIQCGPGRHKFGGQVEITSPELSLVPVHDGGRVTYLLGPTTPGEIRIVGEGLHEKLKVGQEIEMRVISPCQKERLIASGYVESREYGSEPQTVVRMNGRKMTYCIKRRGKWKITRNRC